MKHAKRWLAGLLAGVLALAAFTGCSSLIAFATVQTSTEDAQKLMQQVDPALTYDDRLEYAAERVAEWIVEETTNLSAADGELIRRVALSADSGNMMADNAYDFIDLSTSGMLFLPHGAKVAMRVYNEGNPYFDPGKLYMPAAESSAKTLRTYADGCTRMGAVFIQYSGETYVVALFQ